jgi:hypothetical protein
MIQQLIHSRKVLLALLGVIQTLVLHYLSVPPEIWASIDVLLVVLIEAIAREDIAALNAGTHPSQVAIMRGAAGQVGGATPPDDPGPGA